MQVGADTDTDRLNDTSKIINEDEIPARLQHCTDLMLSRRHDGSYTSGLLQLQVPSQAHSPAQNLRSSKAWGANGLNPELAGLT